VVAAALAVYGEVGWAGFTLDAVARRAPVGKAALYRRWPTREALLLTAFEHLTELPEPDWEPVSLRDCLINIAGQVVDMFVGPKAMVLPRILIEAAQYPPHFDEMVQNIVRSRFSGGRSVIQAALDDGALPEGTSPDLIVDAVMGGVLRLIVLTPGAQRTAISADRDRYAQTVADFVLEALSAR
jgi:AcrR family transcriptional regulator